MTSEINVEAARDASKLLGEVWHTGIPVDPITVARRSGLRVLETATLDENILGALIKNPGQDPIIMLNENDGMNRRRFTCAHEIGHFVRRGDATQPYTTIDFRNLLSSLGNDPEEVYANEFAACLLMPADEVRLQADGSVGDLELAIRFGVSRDAMQFRLKNLGLRA